MVDCTQASGGGPRFPGIETSVYRARAVVEGAVFEDDEPVEFNDFEIRVSALETWLRFMPARFQVNEDGSRAAIDITHPQPFEFALDDGTTATVRFSWRFGGFAVGSTKVEYEWAAWLGLKSNERGRGACRVAVTGVTPLWLVVPRVERGARRPRVLRSS